MMGRRMKTKCRYCGNDIYVEPKFRLKPGGKQPLADPRIYHLQKECMSAPSQVRDEIRLRDHFIFSEEDVS